MSKKSEKEQFGFSKADTMYVRLFRGLNVLIRFYKSKFVFVLEINNLFLVSLLPLGLIADV
jgi:hypothetical protein